MKVPMSWLKEYVQIDMTPEEYAAAMTMSGSKVEGIEHKGENIQNVVVGKILSIEKHPKADKLVVCQVDTGDDKLQIVTGANNIREGDYIPIAKHGAVLPGGIKIKRTKLREVESFGMMCSIEELGLNKDDYPNAPDDGIFILDCEYPLGTDICDVLGLNEHVIEFEITSNRPDCLSVIGLARETAATFDKKLKIHDAVVKEIGEDVNMYASVQVLDKELCPRYAARIVKNIKIQPSPAWMQNRLRACGIRAINNIVDITNYVMLEYGQPMHAFDIRNLSGNQIIVRRAADGEVIRTLDEQERKLDSSMLVIADAEKPVAVAGVMGGENSEVTDTATTILFESANFNGASVRLSAKKLGMRTEASARFEKGLDSNQVVAALNRACELVVKLGAGEVVNGVIDVDNNQTKPLQLELRPERINKFLGTSLSSEYMIEALQKLGFEVDSVKMQVTVPTFRSDIEGEADLSEEIARIYGYDKIKPTIMSGQAIPGGRNYKQTIEDRIKNALIANGMMEIMTYSFTSPKVFDYLKIPKDSCLRKVITISNPLGEENSIMRTITLGSMLDVMSRNNNRRVEQAKLFELGAIYIPKALPVQELPKEKIMVTLGMYGNYDFYDIKGIVEGLLDELGIYEYDFVPYKHHTSFHPGRTAKVIIKGEELGIIGEIHPDVLEKYDISNRAYAAMLDFDILLSSARLERKYKQLPKYPAITRDIALLVEDGILVKQIEDMIKTCAGELLEEISLFDVYKGKQIAEGMKSVAYSIIFRAADRTLTDDDVNKVFDKIVTTLKDTLGAELR